MLDTSVVKTKTVVKKILRFKWDISVFKYLSGLVAMQLL